MRDSLWDNQMFQFCKGQTQVLITTDIMARNSHLMQQVSHEPLAFTQLNAFVNTNFLICHCMLHCCRRAEIA